ncbi:FecR family protein [Seonamhaeicola sp.]|uniref:FecR family protein n=1 Tax=Seonamhaeicola sp. TaxID=1912245 RepID=UPI0026367A0E|nr:FecR family protein [Seonamhaeicola sp.]
MEFLDEESKNELNNRIMNSARKYRKNRIRSKAILYSSVASFIVFGFSLWFYSIEKQENNAVIKNTANDHSGVNTSSEIKLILSNNEEVEVKSENASIVYSNNGQTLKINNSYKNLQLSDNEGAVGYNTVLVPYGRTAQLTMVDRSKVWLNAGTKFTYPTRFINNRREVFLEGEAIFEVSHQKESPFYVVGNHNHIIKVLGTTFNVSSYPDDNYINTALVNGSVEISYGENPKTQKIIPGTLAVYKKEQNTIVTEQADLKPHMSWRDGLLMFKKNDLKYIMKRISRHYNTPIHMEAYQNNNLTYSGTLDIKKDLVEVMDVLKEIANFDYKITNNKIEILTKKNSQ